MIGKAALWSKPLAGSHIAMIIVAAVSVAAVAAAVFIYALPVQTEVLDARAVLETKRNELASVQQQYTLDRVDQEKVRQLLARVPLSRTDSSYLEQFNEWAKRHNLVLSSFTAAAVRAEDETSGGDGSTGGAAGALDKITFTLALSGRLPDLQRYMAQIHEADPFFAVTQWNIAKGDSSTAATADESAALNSRIMSMGMTIETYLGPQYSQLLNDGPATEAAAP